MRTVWLAAMLTASTAGKASSAQLRKCTDTLNWLCSTAAPGTELTRCRSPSKTASITGAKCCAGVCDSMRAAAGAGGVVLGVG